MAHTSLIGPLLKQTLFMGLSIPRRGIRFFVGFLVIFSILTLWHIFKTDKTESRPRMIISPAQFRDGPRPFSIPTDSERSRGVAYVTLLLDLKDWGKLEALVQVF